MSNLEKVLYPHVGFTKGQVIDYYIRIAPVLLPYLKNRPITLKRYPDGVDGFFFYEKQCPSHRPAWVKTTEVPSRCDAGKIDYCMINDLPALIWAANLADLERPVAASAFARSWAAILCENLRLKRSATVRSAQHGNDL